jgi:hypothetical protein
MHFQDLSVIEVITYEIHEIQYGDLLEIEINPSEIFTSHKV